MDRIGIHNCNLVLHDRLVTGGYLVIEGSKIASVSQEKPSNVQGIHWIDAGGNLVCPGLIEMHTNGALGHDFLDASVDEIHKIGQFHAQHGATSYLATLCTAPQSNTLQAAATIRKAIQESQSGANLLGIHMEGPYFNPDFRRVHPAENVRIYTKHELDEVIQMSGNMVRLFTLAPEMPGGLDFIRYMLGKGIIPAIGHSGATFEEAHSAIEAGATYATHLFAAMRPFHHRQPGIAGACLLDDRVWVEILSDGLHLHPAAVELVWRIKGISRVLVATDSMAGAGLPDGEYNLAGRRVRVVDGQTISPEGRIAGGVGTMALVVRNIMNWLNIPVFQAVALGSYNPACVLGLQDTKGSLEVGKDADLFICDTEINPLLTVVMGKLVFRSGI